MDLTELALPQTNRLASAYMDGEQSVLSLFDYDHRNRSQFAGRLAELQERSFPREALADVLFSYNRRFAPDETVLDNIEKIRLPESVVVIGGQQAGVLTGPLYTIHKCISIIQLAKRQEEQLGVPVVPVFWIAGEDHDFDEINHTFVLRNNRPKKVAVPDKVWQKKSASDIELNQESLKPWVDQIVKAFGETAHTNEVYDLLKGSLEQSSTFTDWFARLITGLFKGHGLVLIDSGDESLRGIERNYFEQMIRKNAELNNAVLQQIDLLHEAGFAETIEVDGRSANLFYKVNEERVLLERDAEGRFRGKNDECLLTEDELLNEVKEYPERFSNNVVSRPIMQESLFPTLAFIAGPGEIAYWSTLKQAFHLFGYKVPLLVPRLNITLLDRNTEKWLNDHGVSAETALTEGVRPYKERWLAGQQDFDIDAEAAAVKENMDKVHERMRQLAAEIDTSLNEIGSKNIKHIFNQIDYLSRQMHRVVRGRHDRELAKFDWIEALLLPFDGPQERVWSVFTFLNEYGIDLVERLLDVHYEFNGKHKIFYL